MMTNSIIEKSCHSCTDRENILERSDATMQALYIWSRKNRHERRSREHSNEKNSEGTKVGCTGSNKRRDRNKQHEDKNSKEQAVICEKDKNRKQSGAKKNTGESK